MCFAPKSQLASGETGHLAGAGQGPSFASATGSAHERMFPVTTPASSINFSSRVFVSAIASSLLLLTTGTTLAADPPAHQMAPSRQMREKMAAMHEKMAACLRSDKPVAECREEMMKDCQGMMGGRGCSMMMGMSGMGNMGHMRESAHGHEPNSPPPQIAMWALPRAPACSGRNDSALSLRYPGIDSGPCSRV